MMRRKPKTEVDPPEPYRHYRVPDGSVDDATVPDATTDDDTRWHLYVVVVMIGLSIVSIGFYVAIFAVIALVLANMLGLIDWPIG